MSLLSSNRGNGKSLLDNGDIKQARSYFQFTKFSFIFVHFRSPFYKIIQLLLRSFLDALHHTAHHDEFTRADGIPKPSFCGTA